MTLEKLVVSIAFVGALLAGPTQGAEPERAAVAAWTSNNQHMLLDEYEAFLRLPNVATDPVAIRRNADHLVQMMQRRGLSPRLLEIDDNSAPPAVYGEWIVPGALRTLGVPQDAPLKPIQLGSEEQQERAGGKRRHGRQHDAGHSLPARPYHPEDRHEHLGAAARTDPPLNRST